MWSPKPNNDFARRIQVRDDEGKFDGALRHLRIGILDIEAGGFDAEYEELFCTCIKEVNEHNLKGKVHTVSIIDKKNPGFKKIGPNLCTIDDAWVVKETVKLMDSFDVIITWYGCRYDIPFINTKALILKIPIPIKSFRRDLCFVARGSYKFSNNRLATVGKALFGKSGKSFLDRHVWKRATRGSIKDLKYIIDHCDKDVIETEKIYKRFMGGLGKLRRG